MKMSEGEYRDFDRIIWRVYQIRIIIVITDNVNPFVIARYKYIFKSLTHFQF